MFPLVLGIWVCDRGLVNRRSRKISCFPGLSKGERRRTAGGPLTAWEGCRVAKAEFRQWKRGWRKAVPAHCRQGLCQTSTVHFEPNYGNVWTWGRILARLQFGDVVFRTLNFSLGPSLIRCVEEATKYNCLGGYVCSVRVQPAWSQQRPHTDVPSASSRSKRETSCVTNVMQLSRRLLNDWLSWTLMIQLSFAPAGLFLTR